MPHLVPLVWAKTQIQIPEARSELLDHFESATERHSDCSALVGTALTRRSKPYLVHCMSREFFVFELTSDQARRLDVQNNMLVRITGHQCEVRRPWNPMVTIEQLSINHHNALYRDEPIMGRLFFRMFTTGPYPLIVRLSFDSPSGPWISCWYEAARVSMSGVIDFEFPSFQLATNGRDSAFTGPVAMFVQLTARIWPDDLEWRMPISDIRGVLVDVRSRY